jgi:hypothetical protein
LRHQIQQRFLQSLLFAGLRKDECDYRKAFLHRWPPPDRREIRGIQMLILSRACCKPPLDFPPQRFRVLAYIFIVIPARDGITLRSARKIRARRSRDKQNGHLSAVDAAAT